MQQGNEIDELQQQQNGVLPVLLERRSSTVTLEKYNQVLRLAINDNKMADFLFPTN